MFFLMLGPGVVCGLIPWWISKWRVHSPFIGFAPIRVLGVLLVFVSVLALLESFARFALQGAGTPAPLFPTRHLVVTGLYRYVRNPMYLAVLLTILGQAIFFGSVPVMAYGALVWLAFHLFVLAYEEPTLRKTFGAEYAEFCANVPRWVPRLSPWRGNTRET
jgi:protein-S-isoprenylcysteine O-methyltransferase Ste14